MVTKRIVPLVAVNAAGVLASVALAQTPAAQPNPAQRSAIMIDDLQEKLAKEEPAIKARQSRIDAELATLDRATLKESDWAKEWAGVYYTGDGLGVNLSIHIAPTAGISFLNYGCLGLYSGDHGDVVEALPDGLILKLLFGSAQNSFLSERMYFVRWGREHFLVPDRQLIQFVNNYNEGGHARACMFGIPRLMREGEKRRLFGVEGQLAGRPQLPTEFMKMLLDKPVTLKVVQVSAVQTREVTTGVACQSCLLEFGGGTNQGVFVGMTFDYPSEAGPGSGSVLITRADATTCTGEFTAYTNPREVAKQPVAGESVRTGKDALPLAEPSDKKGGDK